MKVYVLSKNNEHVPITGELGSILVMNDKGQSLFVWDKKEGMEYAMIKGGRFDEMWEKSNKTHAKVNEKTTG